MERDRTLINELRLLRRRSVTEIARIVSDQYLEEIADEETGLNVEGKRPPHVGKKQVAIELDKIVEEYKENRADEIYAKRLGVIRQYEALAGICYEEYEKSKADKLTTHKETTQHPEYGEITKDKEVVETRLVGDKGYLSLIVNCTDKIAELEAIIPPRKTALTNPDGTEPFKFEGAEELRRLSALADELLNPASKDKLPEVVG